MPDAQPRAPAHGELHTRDGGRQAIENTKGRAIMAGENTQGAPFSPEQIESLNAMMGSTVNSILTARLKTTEKQLLEKTGTTISEALKAQLPELLKELRPAPAEPDPDLKGGKGNKGESVQLATLQKTIDELRRTSELSTAKAKAAEAKQREMEKQRVVVDGLAKLGITDPFKQELALAHLERKKRVVWSGEEEDASLLWNDEGGNQVSFPEGFASWGKSEEVKHFLPPTGMRGSGSGPVRNPIAPNGQKLTDEQKFTVIGESLRSAWDSTGL